MFLCGSVGFLGVSPLNPKPWVYCYTLVFPKLALHPTRQLEP